MSIKANIWSVAFVAAVLGAATGVMMNVPEATAQEGRAGHVIALAGAVNGSEQALYVLDTREQILMVYEYGLGRGGHCSRWVDSCYRGLPIPELGGYRTVTNVSVQGPAVEAGLSSC